METKQHVFALSSNILHMNLAIILLHEYCAVLYVLYFVLYVGSRKTSFL
jgi:hypothetical protein